MKPAKNLPVFSMGNVGDNVESVLDQLIMEFEDAYGEFNIFYNSTDTDKSPILVKGGRLYAVIHGKERLLHEWDFSSVIDASVRDIDPEGTEIVTSNYICRDGRLYMNEPYDDYDRNL